MVMGVAFEILTNCRKCQITYMGCSGQSAWHTVNFVYARPHLGVAGSPIWTWRPLLKGYLDKILFLDRKKHQNNGKSRAPPRVRSVWMRKRGLRTGEVRDRRVRPFSLLWFFYFRSRDSSQNPIENSWHNFRSIGAFVLDTPTSGLSFQPFRGDAYRRTFFKFERLKWLHRFGGRHWSRGPEIQVKE